MAETITYDPANDPEAIAEADARDAENLEQGEKMVAEQEALLAGKYKNAEDLEKAYLELQQKLGEDTPSESVSEETTEQSELQFYTEDGSVNYETASEVYGEQLSGLFKGADIDPFAMNDHFVNNNGTLSEDMYKQLNQVGLSKSLVDSYLEGVRSQTGIDSAPASLNDSEVSEIKGLAGGEQGYDQLMAWATDNLAPDTAKNYDDVVATGNKAAISFAVKALQSQYEDSVGRDSSLVQGKAPASGGGDVYRSMAEVVRDMNNPEYDRDPALRMDIQRKLERSNLQL